MFLIGKNPLCSDIEKLNNAISQEPRDKTLILSLARHTDVNFLAQTWIAQLIAHLAQREEGLMLRDAHNSWKRLPLDRFMGNIDGVATLVYSQMLPKVQLVNAKQETAPKTLYDELDSRLRISSRLEDTGQIRTFIAKDPDHPMPIEFTSLSGPEKKFRYLIQDILREFNYKFGRKPVNYREMEIALHSFVYEVFQNTFEHGRYSVKGELISGLRYLRIRTYIGKLDELCRRAEGFPELKKFISRHDNDRQKTLRFMEFSVSDAGQGIVSHYINSSSRPVKSFDERKALLHDLIGANTSSKEKISGVGLGLPNAMKALSKLKAFISLRTEEFWMYRDFNDSYKKEQAESTLR